MAPTNRTLSEARINDKNSDLRAAQAHNSSLKKGSLSCDWYELVKGHLPDRAFTKINTTVLGSEELHDCFLEELYAWKAAFAEAEAELAILSEHFSETQIAPWMTNEFLYLGVDIMYKMRRIVDTRIKRHIAMHESAIDLIEAIEDADELAVQDMLRGRIQHPILQEALVLKCRKLRQEYFKTYWRLKDEHDVRAWTQTVMRSDAGRDLSEVEVRGSSKWRGLCKPC